MVISGNFQNRISRVNGAVSPAEPRRPSEVGKNFGEILKDTVNKTGGLKFSKHAEQRMQARNIRLSNEQTAKVKEAVDKAEAKGVKDTLVIMDGLAFVVNVHSRTVITAVSESELKNNVFTNIDGTVIA